MARLASFGQLCLNSDPLIVSKFHNETHDPKGQENKIYIIVRGRETIYRRHTVPVTSCSEVKLQPHGDRFSRMDAQLKKYISGNIAILTCM